MKIIYIILIKYVPRSSPFNWNCSLPNERTNKRCTKLPAKYRVCDVAHWMPFGSCVCVTYYIYIYVCVCVCVYIYTYNMLYICIIYVCIYVFHKIIQIFSLKSNFWHFHLLFSEYTWMGWITLNYSGYFWCITQESWVHYYI